tara:strand:- start:397 stop:633 length:237 start_codon:yes stop_codon:yes gene_type:complete
MAKKTKHIKMPMDCVIMDKEPQEIANPYTGQKATLTPEAIAVYDTIKGAELVGDYERMRKGIDWFRVNYPKEYMVLLD